MKVYRNFAAREKNLYILIGYGEVPVICSIYMQYNACIIMH